MSLSIAHWVYLGVTVLIIVTMLFRRGVVLPTLIGTFVVALIYNGSLISGFQAIFHANLVAAKELFSIFLIITFMVALLHSLKDLGSDKRMIAPIEKLMVNKHVAFLILTTVTFAISLFFWPTPAIPLIGALLIPAAMRAGLPAMTAAVCVSLAGQGMALSSDYVMQIAPMLSATAAGVATGEVADKSLVLSFITGGTALTVAYLMMLKSSSKKQTGAAEILSGKDEAAATFVESLSDRKQLELWSRVFAVAVPMVFLVIVLFMYWSKLTGGVSGFEGGDGAALIGGAASVLLVLTCLAYGRKSALDRISDHITDGFVFAFRAMGSVIPIAGFFFLGSGDFSGTILSLGEEAAKPAFLFDLVQTGQSFIPQNSFLTAFGILVVGMITGLDGSGFSGLPLTGGLSGALAPVIGMDPSVLAAIGQMGAIWTGGGALIAWSSLVAVAGFVGVSPIELARVNFIPVIMGLAIATLFAVIVW